MCKSGKINLLVPESEADIVLSERIKNFNRIETREKIIYRMPYIQTTLLQYELINLEYELKGSNIRIKEKSGMRKDRYSSLAYNYWVQCQLERNLIQKSNSGFSMNNFVKGLSSLSRKPKTY